MTIYENTASDCIRWVDENGDLFSELIAGMGISFKQWKELQSKERVGITLGLYQIFLGVQDEVMNLIQN